MFIDNRLTGKAKEIWETEFAQKHLASALEYSLRAHQEAMLWQFGGNVMGGNFDSPLEAAFMFWWLVMEAAQGGFGAVVTICQQRQIDLEGVSFRADFVLEPAQREVMAEKCKVAGLKMPLVAVELDGHEFHEKTKEQASYRNKRDRLLASAGWTVLHYSGSEFHRDPPAAIMDAFDHAHKLFGATEMQLMRRERELMTPDQIAAEQAWLKRVLG